jgi:hypothetical protein
VLAAYAMQLDPVAQQGIAKLLALNHPQMLDFAGMYQSVLHEAEQSGTVFEALGLIGKTYQQQLAQEANGQ